MADLTGLTPEQITSLSQSSNQSYGQMLNAIAALQNFQSANAKMRMSQKELESLDAYRNATIRNQEETNRINRLKIPKRIPVTHNGVTYNVPENELDGMLEVMRKTANDNDNITLHLPTGPDATSPSVPIKVNRRDWAPTLNALANWRKSPFQIDYYKANANEANARAGETRVDTAQKSLQNYHLTQAAEALRQGKKFDSPEVTPNLLLGLKGAAGNLPIRGDSIKPNEISRISEDLDARSKAFRENPKISIPEVELYNKDAARIQSSTGWYLGDNGKANPVNLPFDDDLNRYLTMADIEDIAARKGVSTSEVLRILAEQGR